MEPIMTHSYSSRYPQFNNSQFNNSQPVSSQRPGNTLDKEQAFSDVIAAISEGKYSWACVLMLRAAGYNPLHYMPYRTYNRIIKANLNLGGGRSGQRSPLSKSASDYGIADLPHLEATPEQATVRGGWGRVESDTAPWWSTLLERAVGAPRSWR